MKKRKTQEEMYFQKPWKARATKRNKTRRD